MTKYKATYTIQLQMEEEIEASTPEEAEEIAEGHSLIAPISAFSITDHCYELALVGGVLVRVSFPPDIDIPDAEMVLREEYPLVERVRGVEGTVYRILPKNGVAWGAADAEYFDNGLISNLINNSWEVILDDDALPGNAPLTRENVIRALVEAVTAFWDTDPAFWPAGGAEQNRALTRLGISLYQDQDTPGALVEVRQGGCSWQTYNPATRVWSSAQGADDGEEYQPDPEQEYEAWVRMARENS